MKLLGLRFASVDLLRSSAGSKVLEVTSSPALEDLENATDINIARQVIAYLEQALQHRPARRKRTKAVSS